MQRRPGFTMLELLVTIGIIGIIAATSIPTYAAAQRRLVLNQTTAEMANFLVAARTKAMTSSADVAISVSTNSVVQVYDTFNKTWNPPGGFSLSPTSFTFTKLTGTTTLANYSDVTVTSPQGLSRIIRVNANGKVSLP